MIIAMEHNKEKELSEFIQTTNVNGLITGIVFLCIGLFSLLGFNESDAETGILICFGMSILGVGTIVPWCIGRNRARRSIARLKTSGKMDKALSDFENGERLFDCGLIVGEYFLISQKAQVALEYSEIRQIYQVITRKGGMERYRDLVMITTNGRKLNIADLRRKGGSDQELKKFLIYVLIKNPAVKIGIR